MLELCTLRTVGSFFLLGNDGNVGGNDGLGAFRDELEALVLVRRVLKEALFSFKLIWQKLRLLRKSKKVKVYCS